MPQNLLCHVKAIFQTELENWGAGSWCGAKTPEWSMPAPYPATENEASAHPPLSPGFLLAAMLDDHVDVNRPDICALRVDAQCALKNGSGAFRIP